LVREWPENAHTRGAEATWEFFLAADDAWEEGSAEWGELIDAREDKLVANRVREVRGKASRASVFTFRDGKMLRWEWFANRAEALEAAGLQKFARTFSTSGSQRATKTALSVEGVRGAAQRLQVLLRHRPGVSRDECRLQRSWGSR
jgi:hypothetical protein